MAEVSLVFNNDGRLERAVERGRRWPAASTGPARASTCSTRNVCRLRDIQDLFAGTGRQPQGLRAHGPGAPQPRADRQAVGAARLHRGGGRDRALQAAARGDARASSTRPARTSSASATSWTRCGASSRSIERQAKKAQQYKALHQERQALDLALLAADYAALAAQHEALTREMAVAAGGRGARARADRQPRARAQALQARARSRRPSTGSRDLRQSVQKIQGEAERLLERREQMGRADPDLRRGGRAPRRGDPRASASGARRSRDERDEQAGRPGRGARRATPIGEQVRASSRRDARGAAAPRSASARGRLEALRLEQIRRGGRARRADAVRRRAARAADCSSSVARERLVDELAQPRAESDALAARAPRLEVDAAANRRPALAADRGAGGGRGRARRPRSAVRAEAQESLAELRVSCRREGVGARGARAAGAGARGLRRRACARSSRDAARPQLGGVVGHRGRSPRGAARARGGGGGRARRPAPVGRGRALRARAGRARLPRAARARARRPCCRSRRCPRAAQRCPTIQPRCTGRRGSSAGPRPELCAATCSGASASCRISTWPRRSGGATGVVATYVTRVRRGAVADRPRSPAGAGDSERHGNDQSLLGRKRAHPPARRGARRACGATSRRRRRTLEALERRGAGPPGAAEAMLRSNRQAQETARLAGDEGRRVGPARGGAGPPPSRDARPSRASSSTGERDEAAGQLAERGGALMAAARAGERARRAS